jgi:hypothetical protein
MRVETVIGEEKDAYSNRWRKTKKLGGKRD